MGMIHETVEGTNALLIQGLPLTQAAPKILKDESSLGSKKNASTTSCFIAFCIINLYDYRT